MAELTDLEMNGLVIIMIEYELIDSQDGRGDHCQSKRGVMSSYLFRSFNKIC